MILNMGLWVLLKKPENKHINVLLKHDSHPLKLQS